MAADLAVRSLMGARDASAQDCNFVPQYLSRSLHTVIRFRSDVTVRGRSGETRMGSHGSDRVRCRSEETVRERQEPNRVDRRYLEPGDGLLEGQPRLRLLLRGETVASLWALTASVDAGECRGT